MHKGKMNKETSQIVEERKCEECTHYVIRSQKFYSKADCAVATIIMGCEVWECEFKPKENNDGEQ